MENFFANSLLIIQMKLIAGWRNDLTFEDLKMTEEAKWCTGLMTLWRVFEGNTARDADSEKKMENCRKVMGKRWKIEWTNERVKAITAEHINSNGMKFPSADFVRRMEILIRKKWLDRWVERNIWISFGCDLWSVVNCRKIQGGSFESVGWN